MRRQILVAVLAAAVAGMTAAAAVAVAAPSARVAATPQLVARPGTAPQGGTIVLFGRGFPVDVRLELLARLGTGRATRIGSADTNARGEFRAPIRISRRAMPGRYVALACRRNCSVRASARFRVTRAR